MLVLHGMMESAPTPFANIGMCVPNVPVDSIGVLHAEDGQESQPSKVNTWKPSLEDSFDYLIQKEP